MESTLQLVLMVKEITNEQRISRTQNMDVYDTIVKNLNRLRKRGRDVSAIECTCTDLYKKLGYTEQTLKNFFMKNYQ